MDIPKTKPREQAIMIMLHLKTGLQEIHTSKEGMGW
jgi:hypothetical protein|tara:strand:+ start:1268 stop:1375 length:108 start_codon:yes stop_codon:yes gene_type:complete